MVASDSEILVKALGRGTRSVTTPGARSRTVPSVDKLQTDEDLNEAGDEIMLSEEETRLYRSGTARANYLSLDRPDLSIATRELCRRMCGPTTGDLKALRRVAQYLADSSRVVYEFAWQAEAGLRVYTDTDFAGCQITRRSTSGGCAMRGDHLLKHWSTTQKAVTLSSSEAGLGGIVKGAAEALGLRSLANDLGINLDLEIHADSSAALGICKRSGIGRVRHLAVGQLWVQERLRSGDFKLFKVAGAMNPADLFTKHLARDLMDQHLQRMSVARSEGRACSAPEVSA